MSHASEHLPNPRRVAAGKANRCKRGPLTEEGRQRLRAAALKNKPWLHSTGPRTPKGKVQVALNGKRRQLGPRSVREVKADLRAVRALIRSIAETCAMFDRTGTGSAEVSG
jgi:hypothetical protein